MIASKPRCQSVIKPGRARRTNGIALDIAAGRGVIAGNGRAVSRALIRHLIYVRRLRQLLSDDAGQRAENLLLLLDGKGHPQPLRKRLTSYLPAARGGQRRFEIYAWQPSLLGVSPALLAPLHQPKQGRQPDDRTGWPYLTRCD